MTFESNSLDLIAALSSSTSSDDVLHLTTEALSFQYGFCGASLILAPYANSRRQVISTSPPDRGTPWYALADTDPQETLSWRAMSTKTLQLLKWDKDVAIRHSKDPRWQAFYETLEGLGFRRNLSVPIWHPDRRQQIIVNFFSDLSPSAHAEVARHHANALLGIATAMAIRVSAHEAYSHPLACSLTKREVECLLWLASGLRSKEIAHRLGISEWTVHYHLGNSRTKLGATTNEQALCLALQKGLISP